MTELLRRPASVAEPEGVVAVCARCDDSIHVVELSGELDLASRGAALHACASPEHLNVRVDLSGLTFMDCAGYGALVVATSALEHRGGSLVLINPVGEPRRLLTLIEALQRGQRAPLRDDQHVTVRDRAGTSSDSAVHLDARRELGH